MADPFAPTPIVVPRATGSLTPGDEANAKEQAKAAPGLMTIQQFATGIKKRQPELSIVPDDVLVRRMIESHPELVHNIQTSSPRPKQTRDRTPTTEQRTQKFLENHPLIREGALALASGSGIPESDTPVSDTFKGLWKTASEPPQTKDEKAVAAFITLPAYRIAKGIIQQGYGFSQEAFDAIDWQEVMKHPASFDVFKASKEPAMMPDPTDPHKPPVPNPKAGQSQPGTGNEAQFAHGLVGLATTIYSVLKGGAKAKEVPGAVGRAAEKTSSGLTDAVQRAAGTDAHTLTDDVTTKAKESNAAENVKIGERNANEQIRVADRNTAAADKHTAAVDKVTDQNAAAEQDFKTKIERINQDFGEKVTKAKDEHAGDVKVRDQKISELHQQHIDAIKQARKEWVEKTHAAKTAEATKESVENRKEVLQRTQRAYVDRIKDNVAQTYSTVKGKLDARYQQMRKQPAALKDEDGNVTEMPVKDLPLNSQLIKEAVDKGRKTLQGAPADLKVFNDLVRQMEQGDGSMVDATDGAEPLLRPLTWDEGRTHYTALGEKLYSGDLPGNVAKAIKEVRNEGLDAELQRAAIDGVKNKSGEKGASAFKKEYGQLKHDWSTFEDDWRDVGSEGKGASPLAKLRLAVDRGVIAANVLSKNFGDRLIETLAKYKESGANPSLLDETRKYNREATSGSVNVSHFPGTTESVPSRVSVPKAPGKLELPDAPKEPPAVPSADPKVAAIEAEQGKRVQRATEDKPEPKPLPEAPKPEVAAVEPSKPLPSIDEMVADVKDAKKRAARKFSAAQSKPNRHDLNMLAVAGAGVGLSGGHLGYALMYIPIRIGWTKFFRSELGMRAMTRITPADVKVMTDILNKLPEERPEAQRAITDALVEKAKKGEKIPPPSVFSKLLDKAQIGAILRVIAPPQPPPDGQPPAVQP